MKAVSSPNSGSYFAVCIQNGHSSGEAIIPKQLIMLLNQKFFRNFEDLEI
ncbi:MAG: hypothetical protein ACTHJ4_08705 [Candidatus Nucleicultricaceae bacterium]